MALRNYVYVSRNKLDKFYPQVAASGDIELSGKATVNIGVAKLELGAKETAAESDHQRLGAVLRHLSESGCIGTIDAPKDFFAGEFDASSLIHDRLAFFAGSRESEDGRAWLGLTCSAENMLGYSYRDLPNHRQENVGPTRLPSFNPMSDGVNFAQRLRTIWEKEESFVDSEFDADAELNRQREKHKLNIEEAALVNLKPFWNRLVLFVHPAVGHWVRERVLSWLVDPLMWLAFGKNQYRKKVEALQKHELLQKDYVARAMHTDTIGLLWAVKVAAQNIDTAPQRYEFVALRLVDGEVNGERVLLGSPLYLAALFGRSRQDKASW